MRNWFRRRSPVPAGTPTPAATPPSTPLGLVPNGRYMTLLRGEVQEVVFIEQIGGEALVETADGIRYYVAPGALAPVRGQR